MRRVLLVSLVLIVSQFSFACARLSRNTRPEASRGMAAIEPSKIPAIPLSQAEEDDIDEEISESNPTMAEGDDSGAPLRVPAEINERVNDWIKFFTVRDRERTVRFLERGMPLKAHIEKILQDNDMPKELFYLAMIESGFQDNAKSSAKAVGVWQFMRGTGKNYGLSANAYQDERRNWIKSTEAAASYLKDLNNVFGSWYLALAAYNAGEGRIIRSIMNAKTRDFWALAEAKKLPKETMNYVPKFLAAMIVGKNLKRYGLSAQPDEPWPDYESVSVPAGIHLESIARKTGVPLAELRRWNRDLIKDITPPNRSGSVEIYVPKSQAGLIADNMDALKSVKAVSYRDLDRVAVTHKNTDYYVVRRGDSLGSISRNLGLTQRSLAKMNGIRHSRIHVGQRLRYYGGSDGGRRIASVKSLPEEKSHQHHRVRRGENLNLIARRYKTSVQELERLNANVGRSLAAGQRIVVK